jgi:hypothetical protein
VSGEKALRDMQSELKDIDMMLEKMEIKPFEKIA